MLVGWWFFEPRASWMYGLSTLWLMISVSMLVHAARTLYGRLRPRADEGTG